MCHLLSFDDVSLTRLCLGPHLGTAIVNVHVMPSRSPCFKRAHIFSFVAKNDPDATFHTDVHLAAAMLFHGEH